MVSQLTAYTQAATGQAATTNKGTMGFILGVCVPRTESEMGPGFGGVEGMRKSARWRSRAPRRERIPVVEAARKGEHGGIGDVVGEEGKGLVSEL